MPKAYRFLLLPLVMLALAALACAGGSSDSEEGEEGSVGDIDKQMKKYEESLREEADWLWSNMNYARGHTVALDDADCAAKKFERAAPEMTEAAREEDDVAAQTLDQLDYAALLITEAHDMWGEYCDGSETGGYVTAFLESRLTPAYQNLNLAKSTLTARAEAAKKK